MGRMQLTEFKAGTSVVHKALPNEALVVIPNKQKYQDLVAVRRVVAGEFTVEYFYPEELETPIESISREGEVFKALTAKRAEIDRELNGEEPKPGTLIPFNKLN